MPNAVTNAHSSITVENNGSVVTGVDRSGNTHEINPEDSGMGINKKGEPAQLNANLSNRFDDIRYYTGDADT
jgi:hypothetical protein